MTFSSMTLACACATAALFASQLHAQAVAKPPAAAVYTVGKGETVMTIASKLRYPSVTENQMAYAIVRRNPNAFSARSKQRLQPGAKLVNRTKRPCALTRRSSPIAG